MKEIKNELSKKLYNTLGYEQNIYKSINELKINILADVIVQLTQLEYEIYLFLKFNK